MRHTFVKSIAVDSARWLSAFPDARVISLPDAEAENFETQDFVWLVLGGKINPVIDRIQAAQAQFVALTLDESVSEARDILSAGARGYVHAFAVPEVLHQISGVVSSGGVWLGRSLMTDLLTGRVKLPENSHRTAVLTTRERAVALAVAGGKSNKEVARELDITERTVKAHLSACFEKLKVRDRIQLSLAINK